MKGTLDSVNSASAITASLISGGKLLKLVATKDCLGTFSLTSSPISSVPKLVTVPCRNRLLLTNPSAKLIALLGLLNALSFVKILAADIWSTNSATGEVMNATISLIS